jgi:NAD-reducing hydrogenase large subunit
MSIVRADGAMDLYDGALRVRDAEGDVVVDGADVQNYLGLLEEQTQPWTYLKFPYLRALGPDKGWYRVGPLARVQTCDRIPSPRAEAQRQRFLAHGPVQATLAYHWARMIEMLHAMEVIAELLGDDALVEGELVTPLPATASAHREGVGVIEAPRGTLIHHYEIGDDDLITGCDLIVSTTHNNRAMNESVLAAAREVFDGREVSEPMLNCIEVAIRAYDPCLSCATHALGDMPLDVTLIAPDGALRDRVRRHGDGRFERMTA